jgi:hypothetical protein
MVRGVQATRRQGRIQSMDQNSTKESVSKVLTAFSHDQQRSLLDPGDYKTHPKNVPKYKPLVAVLAAKESMILALTGSG